MNEILDDYQKRAIFFPCNSSVIVEAPPGHGKTYVMSRRIEYLLNKGFIKPPAKILGLTFTNAAAGEMIEDIKRRIGFDLLDSIHVMTFHSFCYKVLHAYGNVIGLDRNFLLIGEIQRRELLKEVVPVDIAMENEDFLDEYDRWIVERVLKCNRGFKDPNNQKNFLLVLRKYKRLLGRSRVDYNLLLQLVIDLFTRNPNILEFYRSVYRYLIIDEFQDTNLLQFKLVKILCFGHPRIEKSKKAAVPPVYVLADRQQAIYEFQGATPINIDRAKSVFKCSNIELNVNYRVKSEIINKFASALRTGTAYEPEERISLRISRNPEVESDAILRRIRESNEKLHDICVMSQSSYRLEQIRQALSKGNVPYIFVPDFKATAVEKKYHDLFDSILKMSDYAPKAGTLSSLTAESCILQNLEIKNDDVIKTILKLATMIDQKYHDLSLDLKARRFLNDIYLEINWGTLLRKNVKDKVFLSTIHGVKGLQFPSVHICGLVCFEHVNWRICWSCKWGKEINKIRDRLVEPGRSLYVGITRAQSELYLYATNVNDKGKARKVTCLLKPYRNLLMIEGIANYCN